jgi:hypothetical protein
MRILIAVVLLALPLWCAWAFYAAARAGKLTWWRGLLYGAGFLILLLGNPLANAYLLHPIDSALQRRLFEKARDGKLLGSGEDRVRAALGQPWKKHKGEGPYALWLYAPCKVCMASYGAPFVVYLRDGVVEGFRSGAGETARVGRPAR